MILRWDLSSLLQDKVRCKKKKKKPHNQNNKNPLSFPATALPVTECSFHTLKILQSFWQ